MSISLKQLYFPEVIVLSPLKHQDVRGYFYENFNFNTFQKEAKILFNVVQENISFSKKNVLRGMHFQQGEFAQSKLISVMSGKIFDVVIDIRPKSSNFGKWVSYILDDMKNELIFIPAGFAHGFLALDNNTKVSYMVDKPFHKNAEGSIIWNDVDINIDWPCQNPILSNKDSNSLTFNDNFRLNKF